MSQLVVMGFPQDAAKMMILDDPMRDPEHPEKTRAWMAWAPELTKMIVKICSTPQNEVTEILYSGPKDYISKFMNEVKEINGLPARLV